MRGGLELVCGSRCKVFRASRNLIIGSLRGLRL